MTNVTAKAFRVFLNNYDAKTYQGRIECRESGRLLWAEDCGSVRLNKRDALEDANNMVLWYEGMTLNCDKVNWQYAKIKELA